MEEGALQQELCDAARQLWLRGLLVAGDGLISAELNRRRYVITPPGRRRSSLVPADLLTVDVGGTAVVGSRQLDLSLWLPHRLAYQRRAALELPDGRPARVQATLLACPPMTLALLRRRSDALSLMLPGLAPIAVADQVEEAGLKQSLETHQHIAIRTLGLLCIGVDVASVLNSVETIEHAATIELASERPN